jgi:hypothetical protein
MVMDACRELLLAQADHARSRTRPVLPCIAWYTHVATLLSALTKENYISNIRQWQDCPKILRDLLKLCSCIRDFTVQACNDVWAYLQSKMQLLAVSAFASCLVQPGRPGCMQLAVPHALHR